MEKKTLINYRTLIIIFSEVLSISFVMLFSNAFVHIFAIWGLAVIACILVGFDLIHPYCWFSLSFALYNTAYTILYALNYDTSAGYNYKNSLYTLIAMGVVLVIVGGEKVEKDKPFTREFTVNTKYNDITFFVLAALSIIFAFILLRRGYIGKKAMQAANDVFYSLGVHIIRWMLVIMVIQMVYTKCEDKKKNVIYFITSLAASLALGLFTGERDIIFRAVLLWLVLFFYFRVIKRKHLFIFIPAGILMMILSVNFKYFFLRGEVNTNHAGGSLLYQFLMSDFHATGRNTQFLLNAGWTKGYWGIQLLFNEIARGIIPFVNTFNPATWYNYNVYPGSFKGQAFTYIGFGYTIAGIWGIILVFALLGLFVRYTYKNYNRNLYTLVFYIYSISIVFGCYRGTINSIIGMSLKGALVGILISMFLARFANKKRFQK